MKEQLVNFGFLSKLILEQIEQSEAFRNMLISVAPEIASDIQSAAVNPTCSCRTAVEVYVNNNRDKVATAAAAFFLDNTIFIDLQEVRARYIPTDYTGRVATTTIAEWPKFVKALKKERAAYKTISLLPQGDALLVFFA